MDTKPFCIFYGNLDGIVSYLVLCWTYNKRIPFLATTPVKLEKDFCQINDSLSSYDKIYFLGLDVTKIGKLIDNKKTVIIHNNKNSILYHFEHALLRAYNESSISKLTYDTFIKGLNKQTSNPQKTLVALADDWSAQREETPISTDLNIVLHTTNNKYASFIEDYYEGFKPFDKFKQNSVFLYKKHCKEHINHLKPYFGTVDFENQTFKVAAVFSDNYVEECCKYLFQQHQVDVAIVVMLAQKRIAARRHPANNKIDMSRFVQRIASGGGNENAAGGILTEEFQEFTKLLSQKE